MGSMKVGRRKRRMVERDGEQRLALRSSLHHNAQKGDLL
jgi:hypothetical protein